MADYVRTTWVDDDIPDIDAGQLNRIEAGISPRRDTAQIVTGALAPGAVATGAVALGRLCRILRVAADRACRVRLYGTAAQRDADAGRPLGVDPTGNHGLMMEVVLTAALLTLDLSPQAVIANMDAVTSGNVYYSIENDGAVGAVTVTLTRQTLES